MHNYFIVEQLHFHLECENNNYVLSGPAVIVKNFFSLI